MDKDCYGRCALEKKTHKFRENQSSSTVLTFFNIRKLIHVTTTVPFLNRFRVFQTSKGPFLFMHALEGFLLLTWNLKQWLVSQKCEE